MIPGPHACKDLNSFLFPIIEALKKLGDGIPDIHNQYQPNSPFNLRAFLLLVCGDGPASAKAIGMKNPGQAYRPCHQCTIVATRGENGVYYIPHSAVNPEKLNPRENLRGLFTTFESYETTAKGDVGRQYGLVKKPLLMELPTLSFPQSFPLDLMHCVLLNIVPQIFELMGGKKKQQDKKKQAFDQIRKRVLRECGLAEDTPSNSISLPLPAAIPLNDWEKIGGVQCKSRSLIPNYLGQAPRPIHRNHGGYKAMEWREFLVCDSPALLSHLASSKCRNGVVQDTPFTPAYLNLLLLRKIYLQASNWAISPHELATLRQDCVQFVRSFEEIYYCGEHSRIEVCKLNVHSLLHLGTYLIPYSLAC